MNSRERIITTMNFKEPDRVPLMYQFSIGFMLKQLKKFHLLNSGLIITYFLMVLIELRNIFKFDGILISLHGHDKTWLKNVSRICVKKMVNVFFG